MWRKYRDLYVGGEQLKGNASEYLTPRQKEPADVYSERLSRVFYENYVGSIIDWYAATLFRREPQLLLEGENKYGRKFFSDFAEDCDLKGTSLSDFFRGRLIEALINGHSLILVDFPIPRVAPGSRAEEEELGLSRAYLVDFPSESLINWSRDPHGNFEWVILRSTYFRKPEVSSDTTLRETVWRYYDRERYQIWRQVHDDLQPMAAGSATQPELAAQGFHALAKQR